MRSQRRWREVMESRDVVNIGGSWVRPHGTERISLVDPRTGETTGTVVLADAEDVDRAVEVARRTFDEGPEWPLSERIAVLTELCRVIERRTEEFADTISAEMGAPDAFAR